MKSLVVLAVRSVRVIAKRAKMDPPATEIPYTQGSVFWLKWHRWLRVHYLDRLRLYDASGVKDKAGLELLSELHFNRIVDAIAIDVDGLHTMRNDQYEYSGYERA